MRSSGICAGRVTTPADPEHTFYSEGVAKFTNTNISDFQIKQMFQFMLRLLRVIAFT